MSNEKSDTWHYFNELKKEGKAKYKRKLTLTNVQFLPDPYSIVESQKGDVKLMPHVSWGDMYNYLVNSPTEYTHDNLKAYKSLEAFKFFLCNHVQDIYYNKIAKKSEFCSIKTKIQKNLFKHILIKSLFQSSDVLVFAVKVFCL